MFTHLPWFTGSLKKVLSKPFYIEDKHVGFVEPKVLEQLHRYPSVFQLVGKEGGSGTEGEVEMVKLDPALDTFERRTAGVTEVLGDMREKDLFVTLRGWRDEVN